MDKNKMLEIQSLVRVCGQIMLNANRESILIDSKAGSANFVTEYDKKGLRAIMTVIYWSDMTRAMMPVFIKSLMIPQSWKPQTFFHQ